MNQSTEPKIDCVVRVVTPENIEFEYLLAGPFQRLPAFLIDFAVRLAFFVAMIFLGLLVGIPLGGGLGVAATWVLGFIGFFVLSWLYGTIMEAQFNGRTVGKILLGLRVISTDGRPINGSQAALRNLLRMSDLMPPLSLTLLVPDAPPADIIPTFFVGLLAMTLTARMQRIGDLAAGTMVVWDGRRGVSTNLQPEDMRAFALAEFIPPTFQISRTLARSVALYMERRRFLSQQRRQEIASYLAEPLLSQFELRPDTSGDLLLCALYVRIYHSEQQRSAKLESLRGNQYTRPTRTAPAAIPMHPPINAHAPVASESAASLAGVALVQPITVEAKSVEDDVLQIIEAQAIEPTAEYVPVPRFESESLPRTSGAHPKAHPMLSPILEQRPTEPIDRAQASSDERGGPI